MTPRVEDDRIKRFGIGSRGSDLESGRQQFLVATLSASFVCLFVPECLFSSASEMMKRFADLAFQSFGVSAVSVLCSISTDDEI